jgi:hypothetical protein
MEQLAPLNPFWKDGEPNMPIPKEAKAEWAKLQ